MTETDKFETGIVLMIACLFLMPMCAAFTLAAEIPALMAMGVFALGFCYGAYLSGRYFGR